MRKSPSYKRLCFLSGLSPTLLFSVSPATSKVIDILGLFKGTVRWLAFLLASFSEGSYITAFSILLFHIYPSAFHIWKLKTSFIYDHLLSHSFCVWSIAPSLSFYLLVWWGFGSVMVLSVTLPNSYFEVLSPSTSEYNCIWR